MSVKNNNFKIIIIIAIYATISSIIASSVMIVIELLGLKILLLYIISYAIIMATDIAILYYAIEIIMERYTKMLKIINEPVANAPRPGVERKAIELTDSESAIVSILEKNNGRIMQNSLTGKTGYSAPTISRILTTLEEKGVIDRRRHGMTNEISLKER
ncbi:MULTISPECIES: helix-turn-helix transcriptional regulator [Ferroplasma]|jgi:uncharacterized membrane protein|uniref:DUF7343 domain-containing protein n=2 Tax=Ferroplasma TaxID=74968 RepID=S0AQG6_FERAC|nr:MULTISPECIES: winged helix-turn-helix transcriptional regulator [Ferroplasma]MCL4349543.1 winged helix-turn-helix transcriptional regulator [Candidatus Thermoplasmatota archaeon]AGO61483.1 hypothetical protein FACI_IFERC00001G1503 [Ferroplasma acidarmanus Fer1]ARD84399.1 MarR-2 group transcriptional regulator [Ferroplasma acidiphilum]NOL60920.1 winged helix-turn-helix transcriptional regulator [Ferroplasma acidiphilum]WMT53312.1 MAG: winged helix-turn-helix transcriptional regulator [Ferrop